MSLISQLYHFGPTPNLSYRFPISETSATALGGTTGKLCNSCFVELWSCDPIFWKTGCSAPGAPGGHPSLPFRDWHSTAFVLLYVVLFLCHFSTSVLACTRQVFQDEQFPSWIRASSIKECMAFGHVASLNMETILLPRYDLQCWCPKLSKIEEQMYCFPKLCRRMRRAKAKNYSDSSDSSGWRTNAWQMLV